MISGVQMVASRAGVSYLLLASLASLDQGSFLVQLVLIDWQPAAEIMTASMHINRMRFTLSPL